MRESNEKNELSRQYAKEELEIILGRFCDLEKHLATRLIYIASIDDDVAGCGMLTLATGEVRQMTVSPAFQGRGVGSAILREILAAARARNLGKLYLECPPVKRDWYARFGFVDCARRPSDTAAEFPGVNARAPSAEIFSAAPSLRTRWPPLRAATRHRIDAAMHHPRGGRRHRCGPRKGSTALARRLRRTFPCDVLFVKGKKVAGTTLGGVVRRIGKRHGVDFFAPTMPSQVPRDWRSGGRERWVLEEFGRFLTRSKGLVGWGQEQTLSPRKKGLADKSGPLQELAAKALRLTAVRDPVKHAISACTHFGPCGRRSSGGSAYNVILRSSVELGHGRHGLGQMSRFVANEPEGSESPADFYHAIFVTDRLDESLVALALSLKLDLEDVLYVSAKTSHTQRRPKTEALDRDFKQGLRRAFYGDQYTNSEPPLPLPRSKRPADFSPDAALYHDAVARLDATIASLPTFEVHLRRFRKMRRLVEACARAGAAGAARPRRGACLFTDQVRLPVHRRVGRRTSQAPRGAAGPREQPPSSTARGKWRGRRPRRRRTGPFARRPRAGNGVSGAGADARADSPPHRPGARRWRAARNVGGVVTSTSSGRRRGATAASPVAR